MKKIRSLLLSIALVLFSAVAMAGQVDINSADANTFAGALHGIGMAKAEAIVAHRDANGPFASVDDLASVRGVGQATVDRNRDKLTVGKPGAQ